MAVGQARQALEAGVAEDLELAAHDGPRSRPGHDTQGGVHLGEPANVRRCIAAPKGLRRRLAAPVHKASRVPILPDQTGQLGAGQSRHLGQVAPDHAPIRLAQAQVVEPHQRPANEIVSGLTIGDLEIHPLVAVDHGANLIQGPKSFSL